MSDPHGPDGQTNDPDPYGGAPQSNPYGSTPPPPPPPPYSPPSGSPSGANPYAAPGYDSPGYYSPGYPGGPADPQRTDGVSVGALVASLLGLCTFLGFLVGIVLGIIGLRRTRQGRAKGRGLAIAGIVVGALGLVIYTIAIVVIVVATVHLVVTPGNAKAGECVDVDHGGGSVSMIKMSCTDSHDAQIIGVGRITSDNLDQARGESFCNQLVPASTQARVAANARAAGVTVRFGALTEDGTFTVGNHVVCYVEGSSKLSTDLLK